MEKNRKENSRLQRGGVWMTIRAAADAKKIETGFKTVPQDCFSQGWFFDVLGFREQLCPSIKYRLRGCVVCCCTLNETWYCDKHLFHRLFWTDEILLHQMCTSEGFACLGLGAWNLMTSWAITPSQQVFYDINLGLGIWICPKKKHFFFIFNLKYESEVLAPLPTD